jgi:ribosomal protein S17
MALQVLVPKQLAHVSCSANMEWGFKETRLAVTVLHKCGKSDSQIFELLKPLKISRNFVYRAIKLYKELCGVERTRSGRIKSVRAEATIKTVRERICRNPLWKQIVSREQNISTQSIRASSGTIYTWQRTSAQRDTFLLLLWMGSDGQEQSFSSSGTLRTGTKTSSSRTRNFHHLGAE